MKMQPQHFAMEASLHEDDRADGIYIVRDDQHWGTFNGLRKFVLCPTQATVHLNERGAEKLEYPESFDVFFKTSRETFGEMVRVAETLFCGQDVDFQVAK